MLIESDARRFVTEAISIEQVITAAENKERAKGKIVPNCEEYNTNRKKLVDVLNKINSVANPEGKGRDDLTIEILKEAEAMYRKVSISESKAVRKLADGIKKSF